MAAASRTNTNNNATSRQIALSDDAQRVLETDHPFYFSVPRSEVPVYGGTEASGEAISDCRLKVGTLLRNSNIDDVASVFAILADGATDSEEGDKRVSSMLQDSIVGLDPPALSDYVPSFQVECNGSGWISLEEQQDLTAFSRHGQCLPVRDYASVLFVGDGSRADLGSAKVVVRWPNARNKDGATCHMILQRITSNGKFEVRGSTFNEERVNAGMYHGRQSDAAALFEPDTTGVSALRRCNLKPDVCNVPPVLQHAIAALMVKMRMHAFFAASQKQDARSMPPLVIDSMHLYPNLQDMDPEARPSRGNKNGTVSVVVGINPSTAQGICRQVGADEELEGKARVFVELGCDGGIVSEDGRAPRHEHPFMIRGKVMPELKAAGERIPGVCLQKPFFKVYAIHDDDVAGPPRDGHRQSKTHWVTGKPGATDRSAVDPEQHDPCCSLNNVPDVKAFFYDVLSYIALVGRKVAHSDSRLAHFERLFVEARKKDMLVREAARAEAERAPASVKAHSLNGYHSTTDDIAATDIQAARHLRAQTYESQLKRKTADSDGYMMQVTKMAKRSGDTVERRGSRSVPEYKLSRTHAHLFPRGREIPQRKKD